MNYYEFSKWSIQICKNQRKGIEILHRGPRSLQKLNYGEEVLRSTIQMSHGFAEWPFPYVELLHVVLDGILEQRMRGSSPISAEEGSSAA